MYGTVGAISARNMGGCATGGDRHARASGSGSTDRPRTGMFTLSARPIWDTAIVIDTDVNADINTDLPENSAPMMSRILQGRDPVAYECLFRTAGVLIKTFMM